MIRKNGSSAVKSPRLSIVDIQSACCFQIDIGCELPDEARDDAITVRGRHGLRVLLARTAGPAAGLRDTADRRR
jgi:hypothetical protein